MIEPLPNGIPPEQLAALSHEFRTPLNGVDRHGAAAGIAPALTAEQRAYVAALTESGRAPAGPVNDVLDYAQPRRRRGWSSSRAPVDVEDLLRSVCELLSPARAREGPRDRLGGRRRASARSLADEGRLQPDPAEPRRQRGEVRRDRRRAGAGRAPPARAACASPSPTPAPACPKAERARIFEAFAQADPAAAARGWAARGWAWPSPAGWPRPWAARLGVAARTGARRRLLVRGRSSSRAGAARDGRLARGPARSPSSRPAPSCARPPARQIEACGGRAVRAEASGRGRWRCTEEGDVDPGRPGAGQHDGRARAAPAAAPPVDPAQARGTRPHRPPYRAAGFAGYLIKPLRRASLVERVLAAGAARPAGRRRRPHRADAAGRRAVAPTGVRVLLAEDNPINAMLARTLLRREGCEVEHVDGRRGGARGRCRAGAYDLVLMDVRMPGMGGMEAARTLRARGVATRWWR